MNEEQKQVFDLAISGKNVFITGGGGVGKSYTLENIITYLAKINKKHGVTATTGSAAYLIGGTTINSFLGIKVKLSNIDKKIKQLKTSKKDKYKRLKELETLIIDEISMMNDEFFTYISDYLKKIKNNDAPFGGVQIILCGDLYQMPPCSGSYFIKSNVWQELEMNIKELVFSHRQKGHDEFRILLERIRKGKWDEEIVQTLLKCNKNKKLPNATILFSTNKNVDYINNKKLDALIKKNNEVKEYPPKVIKKSIYTDYDLAPLRLCKGVKVMLTHNIDTDMGLCNGAKGVVKSMQSNDVTVTFDHNVTIDIPYTNVYDEDDNHIMAIMPLRLAYAITINKCQGMTLNNVVLWLDDFAVFKENYGRLYTALSRVRSIDNLQIVGKIKKSYFDIHEDLKSI